tara:strand:+ start:124 stop:462 length:339 start_codon:yes stop_codon:yes gene_type:complete
MDPYKGKPLKINSEVLKAIRENSAKHKNLARHYLEFEIQKEATSEETVEHLAMVLAVNAKHLSIIDRILLHEQDDSTVEVFAYELLTITASVREIQLTQELLEAVGFSFKFN